MDETMHNNHPGSADAGTLRVIAFGFVATFVSSFGQTFFVGLFSPQFGAAANIRGTTVSLLYGIATLASGSRLFWLGGAMDRIALRLAATAGVLSWVSETGRGLAPCLFRAFNAFQRRRVQFEPPLGDPFAAFDARAELAPFKPLQRVLDPL
nr:hypothetical protein [Salinisphaera sp. LB1]